MHDPKQVSSEKIARIRAAVNLEPHDRVPVVGMSEMLAVPLTGKHTIQEAFYSPDVLAACYNQFFSDWPAWDAFSVIPYSLGPLLDALGSRRYNVPGRDLDPNADFQHPDLTLMEPSEYPDLIRDPVRFLGETILPRLCANLNPQDRFGYTKTVAKAALYFGQWVAKVQQYNAIWTEQYGVPPVTRGNAIYLPCDLIADKLRGFEQGLLDVHEHTEELQEACEALYPFALHFTLAGAPAVSDFPLLFNPQHVSPYISPRSYEKVYWPTFKRMMEDLTGRGYRVWVLFEHDQAHHLEKMQELPHGKIVAHLEDTDLAEAKKKLGGRICIAGGMPGRVLARGTVQEVRDQTRSVLKLFEDDPGFIMTCGCSIPTNIPPENLRAWLETVLEYGRLPATLPPSAVATAPAAAGGVTSGPLPYTPWAEVRDRFGPIQGDEQVIADKWEELERLFVPFLWWLIR